MLEDVFHPVQTAAIGALMFALLRFRSELIQMQRHISSIKFNIETLRLVCKYAAAVPAQWTPADFHELRNGLEAPSVIHANMIELQCWRHGLHVLGEVRYFMSFP